MADANKIIFLQRMKRMGFFPADSETLWVRRDEPRIGKMVELVNRGGLSTVKKDMLIELRSTRGIPKGTKREKPSPLRKKPISRHPL